MQHVSKLKVLKLSGCRLTAEDLAALGERKALSSLFSHKDALTATKVFIHK